MTNGVFHSGFVRIDTDFMVDTEREGEKRRSGGRVVRKRAIGMMREERGVFLNRGDTRNERDEEERTRLGKQRELVILY